MKMNQEMDNSLDGDNPDWYETSNTDSGTQKISGFENVQGRLETDHE